MKTRWPLVAAVALLMPGLAAPSVADEGAEAESRSAPRFGKDVVAVVNEQPILIGDLESQLARMHGSAAAGVRSGFDLERLVDKMINDLLIAQEARAMGMDEEPPIPEKIEEFRVEAAISKLKSVEIDTKAEPTEDEIRAVFEEQYRRATFRVLTAHTEEEALELLALVREGADIETLAKERSKDPYALRGGLVFDVPKRDLQRGISDVVFELTPGEIAGPIQTDLGWSLIRLDSTAKADPNRYEQLRGLMASVVRFNKIEAQKKQLARTLREKFTVEIDKGVVESIRPESQPDARIFPTVEDEDAIVARVAEEISITADEYGKALFARWAGVRNVEAARAAAPIILQSLIRDKLLMAEALSRGYAEDPLVLHAARGYETQLLIPRYLESILAPRIEVTTDEMRDYYEDHKNEMRMAPQFHLAQITVSTMEEAERLAALARGGADFAWLAKNHSTDRFKEIGGVRDWITARPGADEFQQRLLDASPGDVLEPFGSEKNFVVLKVLDRREQGPYPFDVISGNIRIAVQGEKEQEAINAFLETLRSRSEIEVNQDAIARLQITGSVEEKGGGRGEATGHGH
jgi:parvulin-like peptidyl-prolyl isomerase